MSLDLHVDTERWRAQVRSTALDSPGLVPVAKGNGYGFGIGALARAAGRLEVPLLAVATVSELALAAGGFDGRLLVLEPWRPFDPPLPSDLAAAERDGVRRVVRTVDRVEDIAELVRSAGSTAPTGAADAPVSIVVELQTSMRRHGLAPAELPALGRALAEAGDVVRVEGFALHLPLPGHCDPHAEVEASLSACTHAGLSVSTLFVSHVHPSGVARLAAEHPQISIRPRIGTALWLGDPDTWHVTSSVLAVHPIGRGERFGYRQRRAPMDGHLVVCSGGTANGIATEPPSHVGSVRHRVRALAVGGLEAAGFALSPFRVGARRRWFAEPPHMQVSMLLLPAKVPAPVVGEYLQVNAGMTLTRADRVLWE